MSSNSHAPIVKVETVTICERIESGHGLLWPEFDQLLVWLREASGRVVVSHGGVTLLENLFCDWGGYLTVAESVINGCQNGVERLEAGPGTTLRIHGEISVEDRPHINHEPCISEWAKKEPCRHAASYGHLSEKWYLPEDVKELDNLGEAFTFKRRVKAVHVVEPVVIWDNQDPEAEARGAEIVERLKAECVDATVANFWEQLP